MQWACAAYGLSLIGVYFFSTMSHAVREPAMRHRMRAWDQGVIYCLIAGTYTPFIWCFLEGWLRVVTIIAVWGSAFLGFYSKVIAKHRVDSMASTNYVMLGWGPAAVLFSYVPLGCFGSMALGGLLYTIGTYFLHNDHRSWYFHPLWHVMVIVASACHYIAILYFVLLVS